MPRHRTATNVLRLSGTLKKNPQRARDREGEPTKHLPLGPAPAHLGDAERAAWQDITRQCHIGLLWQSDGLTVELAARMLSHVRTLGLSKTPPAMLARLESLLSKMGMTPSDRSRVHVNPPEANEFDQFDPVPRPRRR